MPAAGRLDGKVTLRRPTRSWAGGEPAESWADAGTFWASVDEESGREAIRAGQVEARQAVIVTARWVDAGHASPQDRIQTQDGRTLEVHSVRELGRREGAEILCTLATP